MKDNYVSKCNIYKNSPYELTIITNYGYLLAHIL